MSLPPLYVLRHGQTEWNALGRLQGGFDSKLTAEGRNQAVAQNRILRTVDLTGFKAISSPQARAYETAVLALNGLVSKIGRDVALREIGLGDWAGQDRDRLVAQQGVRDGFDLYALAPGGEGTAALRQRCTAFLSALRGPTVVVTHGMTSRMIRLIATGRPDMLLRDIGGGQGVVFTPKMSGVRASHDPPSNRIPV